MGPDPQRRILKDAVGEQGQDLAPIGPQLFFPAAAIDVLRAQDPVTGRPVVNLVIGAGNGALSAIVPIPAEVTAELAMAGQMTPATVLLAQQLVGPDYRIVRVDASALNDAPADVATGEVEVEAEILGPDGEPIEG
jgi:hypothetical protein